MNAEVQSYKPTTNDNAFSPRYPDPSNHLVATAAYALSGPSMTPQESNDRHGPPNGYVEAATDNDPYTLNTMQPSDYLPYANYSPEPNQAVASASACEQYPSDSPAVAPSRSTSTAIPKQQHRRGKRGKWNVKDYDPLWAIKEGFDVLEQGYRSKVKFDMLFTQGAFLVGDVLTINGVHYNHEHGAVHETNVHFEVRTSSPAVRNRRGPNQLDSLSI